MVQEVQTWIGIYNESTLETIEAIWTSSFKIVEWRQTTWWHYTSNVKAQWSVTWMYYSWDSRDSGLIQSTNMIINSQSGKTTFSISDNWLRVPIAWSYRITLYRDWGSSTQTAKIYVKSWGKTLYTKSSSGYISETVEINSNLWKFDNIEIWWEFQYYGSSTAAQCSINYNLTIQQL